MLSVLAIIEFNVGAKDGEQWLPCGADTPRVALSRRLPDTVLRSHGKSREFGPLSLLGSIDKTWLQTNGKK